MADEEFTGTPVKLFTWETSIDDTCNVDGLPPLLVDGIAVLEVYNNALIYVPPTGSRECGVFEIALKLYSKDKNGLQHYKAVSANAYVNLDNFEDAQKMAVAIFNINKVRID